MPDGLVARLQTAAALAASDHRPRHRADAPGRAHRGARRRARRLHDGVHDAVRPRGVDLLLRISGDGATSRIDGWVVPPSPITVTVQRDTDTDWSDETTLEVGDTGRFELPT